MCGGGGSAPPPRPPTAEEKALWRAQADLANFQAKIGRGMWKTWKNEGLPQLLDYKRQVEDWASPARINQQQGMAAADVRQSFGSARRTMMDNLSRYGVNPTSGRYAGGLRELALGQAAAEAGARSLTRHGIESQDLQQKGQLAGLLQMQGFRAAPTAAQAGAGLANVSGQMGQSRFNANQIDAQNYASKQNYYGQIGAGLGYLAGSLGHAWLLR